MTELTITVPNTENPDSTQIVEQVKAALDTLAEDADEIDVAISGLEWTHEDWEYGDPCPACEGTEFHCEELSYGIYEAHGGELTLTERDGAAPNQAFASVMCNEPSCMLTLYRGPTSFLE